MIRKILILTAVLVMVAAASASAKDCPDPCPQSPDCICICPDCTPPPTCNSTCVNDVTVVFRYDSDSNSCVKHFAIPCAPYGCDADGITCANSCTTDSDCSQGAECEHFSGRCTTGPYTCSDQNHVRAASGTETDCTPYACAAGACREQCTQNNHCAPGYSCNIDGRCVLN